MTLADHQRAVLDLLVSEPEVSAHDAYIASVAGSVQLTVVQEIADSWRRFALRRLCPLTWRLMEQRGRLDHHFGNLARSRGLSPFLEVLARQFLEQVAAGDDALDAAVARFEHALIDAPRALERSQSSKDLVIDWPYDPEEVLGRLAVGEPLGTLTPGTFRTVASTLDPATFTIEQLA